MPGSDENVILVESDDEDDTLAEKDDVVFVDMTPIPLRPAPIKSDSFLTPISIDSDDDEDIIFVSATSSKSKSGSRLSPEVSENDVITIAPLESGVRSERTSPTTAVTRPPPTLDTVVSQGPNDLNTTSSLLEPPKLPPAQPSFHDDALSFEDATSALTSTLAGTALPQSDSSVVGGGGPADTSNSDTNKSPAQQANSLSSFLTGSKPTAPVGGTSDSDASANGAGGWSDSPNSPQGLLDWLSDNTSCYTHPTALNLTTDTSSADVSSELASISSAKDSFSTTSTSSTSHTAASPSSITSSFTSTIARLLSSPTGCLPDPLSPPPPPPLPLPASSTSSPSSPPTSTPRSSSSSISLCTLPSSSSSSSISSSSPTSPLGAIASTPSADLLSATTTPCSTSCAPVAVANSAQPVDTAPRPSQLAFSPVPPPHHHQQTSCASSSSHLNTPITSSPLGVLHGKSAPSQQKSGSSDPSQASSKCSQRSSTTQTLDRALDVSTAASSSSNNKKLLPALKRSSSYMQTHPNNIPLKKRRRQRAGGRLSLDSADPGESTDSQKCSWCQLVVCFSDLSHCMQGHGCCGECLQNRAKTLLSKSKRGSLKCPYAGCDSYFAMSQLQRTLPRMVVEILEEKLDQEYINYAADLVWENLGESSAANGNVADGAAAPENEDEDDEEDDSVINDPLGASHKEPTIGSLPVYWEPMDDSTTYKLVELPPDNIEYTEIRCLFEVTMKNQAQIQRILRIQNPILWQFYNVKKLQMEQEEGGQTICERRLCHGTSSSVVEAICKNNFDWRLCGAHGTMYGQGTYFARDSSYSHVYTDNGRSRTIQNNPGHILAMLKKSKYTRKYTCSRHLVPRTSRYNKVLGATNNNPNQGNAGNTNQGGVSNSNTSGSSSFLPNSLPMLQPPPAHFKPVMISPLNNATSQNPATPGAYGPAVGVSVVRTPVYQNPILGFSLPYLSITQTQSSLISQVMHRHFQMQNNQGLPPPAHQRVHNNNNTNPGHPQTHTLLNGNEAVVPAKKPIHSMFIAKVLVGRYTTGHNHYRKPPPLDLSDPYGRAYDSCVDNMVDPKIYVIFDSAQCYPEYLIEYTSNSTSSI